MQKAEPPRYEVALAVTPPWPSRWRSHFANAGLLRHPSSQQLHANEQRPPFAKRTRELPLLFFCSAAFLAAAKFPPFQHPRSHACDRLPAERTSQGKLARSARAITAQAFTHCIRVLTPSLGCPDAIAAYGLLSRASPPHAPRHGASAHAHYSAVAANGARAAAHTRRRAEPRALYHVIPAHSLHARIVSSCSRNSKFVFAAAIASVGVVPAPVQVEVVHRDVC